MPSISIHDILIPAVLYRICSFTGSSKECHRPLGVDEFHYHDDATGV